MIVMKFGGTSVGTAKRIREVCGIVKSRLQHKPFIVVSAHNSPQCRMTDTLIDSAEKALAGQPDPARVMELQRDVCQALDADTQLVEPLLKQYADLLVGISMIGEISPRTMDLVMSFGERMSCLVVAEVLRQEFGVDCGCATAMELDLRTDGVFGAAHPDEDSYPEIRKRVAAVGGDAVVTTGFLGLGPDGHITTLGRGGSDYSATIFGAALGAEEVQIWTDVDGVMTADPRVAGGAHSIPELSFAEASELAWYGARVLHPATMVPAIRHGIPVRVLNTMRPNQPGSLIRPECPDENARVAKSIAHKNHVNLVTVTSSRMLGTHGFMAKVFELLSLHKVDIHMIATSEVSISLTTPPGAQLDKAAEALKAYGDVVVETAKAMVCVVGEKMAGTPGVAARVCTALARNKINIHMISQGASEINIALLVDDADADATVKALHEEFFAD